MSFLTSLAPCRAQKYAHPFRFLVVHSETRLAFSSIVKAVLDPEPDDALNTPGAMRLSLRSRLGEAVMDS